MLPSFRQLEYIVVLAETGQFVEASRRLNVSQPALSKQIRDIEDALGVVLFERTRPKLMLTPAGEQVLTRAERLLAGAEELLQAVRWMRGERQSVLRLGVIPSIAPYGLPGLIAKLRETEPNLAIIIEELQTEPLLEALRAGRVDLAFLARPFSEDKLSAFDLVIDPFVFLVAEGHPLAKKQGIRLQEVVGVDMLLMEDGHCLREQAIEVCRSSKSNVSTEIQAASVSTLVSMVESGLGPTLLPAIALNAELRGDRRLVARAFAAPSPGRRLSLAWRKTSPSVGWYEALALALRAHLLGLNAGLPPVFGGTPRLEEA